MHYFRLVLIVVNFVVACRSDRKVRGTTESSSYDNNGAPGVRKNTNSGQELNPSTTSRRISSKQRGLFMTKLPFPSPPAPSLPTMLPQAPPTVPPTFKPFILPTFAPFLIVTTPPTAQPFPIRPIHLPPVEAPTFIPINPPSFVPFPTPPSKPHPPPSACHAFLPPTFAPVYAPTFQPTQSRKLATAVRRSMKPSGAFAPTIMPATVTPTPQPTVTPSNHPSAKPSFLPVIVPTWQHFPPPTFSPVIPPTFSPSYVPPVFNQFNNSLYVAPNAAGIDGLKVFGEDVLGDTTFDFGSRVALSFDGSIMAVVAPLYVSNGTTVGETCLYHKLASNASQWVLQGSVLGGKTGMALSSDGTVVAVAWSNAARVYRRIGNTWKQMGKAIVGGASFGSSLALASASNATVAALAVGEPAFNQSRGRLTVFHFVKRWRVLGAPILPTDTEFGNSFGFAVALSADGSIVGTSSPNYGLIGNAMVYRYDTGARNWIQLGKDISQSPDNAGLITFPFYLILGQTLALSANGLRLATNLMSGSFPINLKDQARVYQYDKTLDNWVPFGSGATFLSSTINELSMSADGNRLAVGVDNAEYRRGGLFYFAVVVNVSPDAWEMGGSASGGQIVALAGDGDVLAVSKSSPYFYNSGVATYLVP